MTIKITTWRPDTCGCEIEFSWDNTVPAEQRIHTFHKWNKKCSFHASLDGATLYNTVQEENKRKNIVHKIAAERISKITPEDYLWRFDDARILYVSSPLFTVAHKGAIQAAANTRFGTGKVVVE